MYNSKCSKFMVFVPAVDLSLPAFDFICCFFLCCLYYLDLKSIIMFERTIAVAGIYITCSKTIARNIIIRKKWFKDQLL